MKRISLCCLFLLATFAVRAEAASVSLWRWNHIELRLEASSSTRTFLFEKMPIDFARRVGVQPGATFWQGERVKDQLRGEAFLYAPGCTPLTFKMNGTAKLNAAGELVLKGAPPSRKKDSCDLSPNAALKPMSFVFKLVSAPKTFVDQE